MYNFKTKDAYNFKTKNVYNLKTGGVSDINNDSLTPGLLLLGVEN